MTFILQGHTDKVFCIAVTGDNKYIISGSKDKTIRIWNLLDKKQEAILKGDAGYINRLVTSKDSEYIISGSSDGTIRIWNILKRNQESILGEDIKEKYSV